MITLDKDNFQQEVLEGNGLIIVDFWSATCRNCKALMPKYENLAEKNAAKAKFCIFNAVENKELSLAQKVVSVPAIVYYQDGKQVDRLSGVFTVEQIIEHMERFNE